MNEFNIKNINLPKLNIPKLDMPKINVPDFKSSLKDSDLKFDMPKLTDFKTPDLSSIFGNFNVNIPSFEMPDIPDMASFEMPQAEIPDMNIEIPDMNFEMPEFNMPDFDMSKFTIPGY